MGRRQPYLFPDQDIPRRLIIRMHVEDAGHLPGGAKGIRFTCSRCGHDTGWIPDTWTISENRRGHPCPICKQFDPAYQERMSTRA